MKITIVLVVFIMVAFGAYYIVFNNGLIKKPTVNPNTSSTTIVKTETLPTQKDTTINKVKTPESSNITVNIKNFSFNPSTLTVKSGTKVTWVNNDSAPHTITSDTGSLLNSQTLSSGQSFSFVFNNSGSENYHCNIHPSMKGGVIVTK